MFDFSAALCHNSTFRTWQLGGLWVFKRYLYLSVASPFPLLLASRVLSFLDLPCLCFLLLPCKVCEGERGIGVGDNLVFLVLLRAGVVLRKRRT